MQKRLILASSSPRRRELLRQVGINFSVRVTEIDESNVTTNDPVEKVKQLALLKGRSIPVDEDEVTLAADTIVAYNKEIFGKPNNQEEAFQMIRTLSGEQHEVYTGVVIRAVFGEIGFVEKTVVEFWPLDDEEIKYYIQTDDPYDKAGGYGIQSLGAIFVKQIIGDYYNVVGLPLSRVVRELTTFGIETLHK